LSPYENAFLPNPLCASVLMIVSKNRVFHAGKFFSGKQLIPAELTMDGFSLPFVILLYYPEAVIIPPMPVFHLKNCVFSLFSTTVVVLLRICS